MWNMHDVGWGLWLVMPAAMIVLWAAVIWGVVLLARIVAGWSRRPPADGADRPAPDHAAGPPR